MVKPTKLSDVLIPTSTSRKAECVPCFILASALAPTPLPPEIVICGFSK